MPSSTIEFRPAIIDAVRKAADPKLLILFGSQARGDANENSDIDLLIVEEESRWKMPSRRQEIARLRRALPRVGLPIDVLLFTPKEMEKWRSARNHVIAEALQNGVVLYERQ